jgi:outer membrane assembly lipoprotein YfiO
VHGLERVLGLVLVVLCAACAPKGRGAVPPGTMQPDQFLFERGNALLTEKKWLTAREFFKQVTETYTQSPLRPDAKLAIGDTYLGEGNTEALILAQNEFREFLSFYPTHPRADYAQYKLGMTYFRQMRAPQRDQTETRDTIRELQTFVTRYPNSELMPEVKARLREAKDGLSEADYHVGVFYYRQRWFPGAIDRLKTLIDTDPEYTARDGAYFYLGESYMKLGRAAEALPIFERLVTEFRQSEHLEESQKRIETLKATMAANAGKTPAATPVAGSGTPAATPSGAAPAPAAAAGTPVGEGGQSAGSRTPVVASPR